jgi:hypothetical protein
MQRPKEAAEKAKIELVKRSKHRSQLAYIKQQIAVVLGDLVVNIAAQSLRV